MAKSGVMKTYDVPADGRAMLADFIRQRTTQTKFAEEVGCRPAHISLILSGKKGMSVDLARRISVVTGIAPGKLRSDLANFVVAE